MWDAGGATTWGELVALTRAALNDPSTRLGAEAAGWKYPATEPEIFGLIADYGKRVRKILPFDLDAAVSDASRAEVDAANAELEQSIIIAD